MGKPIVEPMDHKTFLSNLPIGTRQKLLIRSNRAGIKHLAIHWGLIALTSGLIVLPVPFWPLLLPIQGVLLISNFMLLHECTHRTPFSSIWLNETVGWIAGIIVGLPFLWFRYFHLVHHKHTNDPAQDPELVGHPKPENWRQYLWHVSGIPTWTTQAVGILKIAGGQDELTYVPPSKKRMVRVESVIIVIFYAFITLTSFFFSTVFLTLWILPVFLAQPLLRLYLMAEHGRCPPVANMLENTRTTYTNKAIGFLAWNMPYHAEHHAQPNVPFYLLPQLNKLVKAHLLSTEPGYGKFHTKYVKEVLRRSETA